MIGRANGLSVWADERNIEIRHADDSVDTLDLFSFNKFGRMDQNKYVQNGDVIVVPAVELSNRTVTITGNVPLRGIHQIKMGETLKQFLLRVEAFDRGLNLEDVFIIRTDEQGKERKITRAHAR